MSNQGTADNAVVIDRVVDAPVQLVWSMWTDPEHFKAWYGPNGASVPVAELDVRVGGSRKVAIEMETPDGPMRMWFVGEFLEIVEPERLVYTEAMGDKDGNAMPAGSGAPGQPESTEVRVELADIGGRTGMTLTHVGVPADSPGATGWQMAIDKLVAHIATAGG